MTMDVAMGAKSLSAPMKEVRSLIRDGVIQYSRHNGLLRWCLSNTYVEIDANNNVRPVKGRSSGRIDGFMGLLLAYIGYLQRKEQFEQYQR